MRARLGHQAVMVLQMDTSPSGHRRVTRPQPDLVPLPSSSPAHTVRQLSMANHLRQTLLIVEPGALAMVSGRAMQCRLTAPPTPRTNRQQRQPAVRLSITSVANSQTVNPLRGTVPGHPEPTPTFQPAIGRARLNPVDITSLARFSSCRAQGNSSGESCHHHPSKASSCSASLSSHNHGHRASLQSRQLQSSAVLQLRPQAAHRVPQQVSAPVLCSR